MKKSPAPREKEREREREREEGGRKGMGDEKKMFILKLVKIL